MRSFCGRSPYIRAHAGRNVCLYQTLVQRGVWSYNATSASSGRWSRLYSAVSASTRDVGFHSSVSASIVQCRLLACDVVVRRGELGTCGGAQVADILYYIV